MTEPVPQSPRDKIIERTGVPSAAAKRWMWTGVGSLTLLILALWGYAMVTQMSFFNWSDTNEVQLFQNTKQQWKQIMNQPDPVLPLRTETVTTTLTTTTTN